MTDLADCAARDGSACQYRQQELIATLSTWVASNSTTHGSWTMGAVRPLSRVGEGKRRPMTAGTQDGKTPTLTFMNGDICYPTDAPRTTAFSFECAPVRAGRQATLWAPRA